MDLSYQGHIDAIKDLEVKEYWIVTGVPGARTDMITSWMATCHPGFHNTHNWIIDTHTGGSLMERPSVFDHGCTNGTTMDVCNQERIDRFKQWIPKLPPVVSGATKSIVAKSHMKPWLFVEALTPEIFLRDFRIIVIDTARMSDPTLEEKLKWEFVVKTFMSVFQIRNLPMAPAILKAQADNVYFTDDYRERLENYDPSVRDRITFLDYDKIITEDGGRYVLDKTGIVQDEIAIEHWRNILPSTHTVKSIRHGGEIWSYQRIMTED